MNDSTSVVPAAVESVGAGRPEENSYPPAPEFQVIVNEPAPLCVTLVVIRWPSCGLDGAPMLRLAPIVTRKSLPALASTAMVAASVSVTTAGDSWPVNVAPASGAPPSVASAALAVVCPVPPLATDTGTV